MHFIPEDLYETPYYDLRMQICDAPNEAGDLVGAVRWP
jgi:hypothetical protein